MAGALDKRRPRLSASMQTLLTVSRSWVPAIIDITPIKILDRSATSARVMAPPLDTPTAAKSFCEERSLSIASRQRLFSASLSSFGSLL